MGRSCLAEGLMGEGVAAATVPHDIDDRQEVVLRGGGGACELGRGVARCVLEECGLGKRMRWVELF